MKFPQILLLFVALVLSATEALPKGRVRSRREALQQARRTKGKGSKSSKSKKSTTCETIEAYRLDAELSFTDTTDGDSLSYPVYDLETDEPIAYYMDSAIYTTPGEGSMEDPSLFQGVYYGSYNFEFDMDAGVYTSAVLIQGVLSQGADQQGINSGMGSFMCASGVVDIGRDEVTDDLGEAIGDTLTFYVCPTC